MNRLVECKPYRIREELEEVLSPWPARISPVKTLSDLDVTLQGAHLPVPIPIHRTAALRAEIREKTTLRARYLPGKKSAPETNEEEWTEEVVAEAMRALETGKILFPFDAKPAINEYEEEPDDSWAMLDSENEARRRFELFKSSIERRFSEYIAPKEARKKTPKSFDIVPPKKAQTQEIYRDKRCEDKRKMLPQVYTAPPYPEYWILKRKPAPPKKIGLKEAVSEQEMG